MHNGSQRKMGLITTQLLNEGAPTPVSSNIIVQPSKSVIGKQDSQRDSKLSLYTDNPMMQFETRTDDGRQGASGREVSGTNAVLTDTKINLFGSQSIPSNARMSNSQTKKSSALISGKGGSQIFNHPVRASRTPHS